MLTKYEKRQRGILIVYIVSFVLIISGIFLGMLYNYVNEINSGPVNKDDFAPVYRALGFGLLCVGSLGLPLFVNIIIIAMKGIVFKEKEESLKEVLPYFIVSGVIILAAILIYLFFWEF